MATNIRRRLSFVDLAHPQVWHKLVEYADVTIAFTKLSSYSSFIISKTFFSQWWLHISFEYSISYWIYESMDENLSFGFVSIASPGCRFPEENRNRNTRKVLHLIQLWIQQRIISLQMSSRWNDVRSMGIVAIRIWTRIAGFLFLWKMIWLQT